MQTSKKAHSSTVSQRRVDNKFETEQGLSQNLPQKDGINPFAQALSKAGGHAVDSVGKNQVDQAEMERQAKEEEKKRKKEKLRQELHKRVNVLDQTEVFSREKIKVQKELNRVRLELQQEIALTSREIKKFYKEIDIATYQDITDQGLTGTGMKAFLEKLREAFRLIRKRIKSARTWLYVQSSKNKKKKAKKGKKFGAGIEVSGAKHEQTKAVFDQMGNEVGMNAGD